MKISQLLSQKQVTVSLEIFPPKQNANFSVVKSACEKIADLKPCFMSITYGAGGGTSEYTFDIAKDLQDNQGITMLPHLTCVSSKKDRVRELIKKYREAGFLNIMALRGDIPEDGVAESDYRYAIELVEDIKELAPDMCIGAACYPDGHPESSSKDEDIINIKKKVDAGVDFLTTQMFFDNSVYYNYLYRLRERGITVPVLAGIMPITNAAFLKRSLALSGTLIPNRFKALVDKFGQNPEAMKKAGMIYAADQIIDLIANDCGHIHIYTMNKPDIAAGILELLGEFNNE